MILLKNGKIYKDGKFFEGDILISEKIESIDKSIDLKGLNTYDLNGEYVIPGFIDLHCHINGAGGEGGPLTRTTPLNPEIFLKSGITTVVGLLGTDGYTRSLIDLLMHVRKLKETIDSYMFTGSYQVPSPTITGSIAMDIILIPEIVGLKISLSDHRSSYPSVDALKKIASEVRVSSMLSGKRGIINVHMGDGKNKFETIYKLLEETEIPIWHFLPTHIDRNEDLLEASVEYAKKGGYLDITANPNKTIETINFLISKGVPEENITVSTDGNGSIPQFDSIGRLIRLNISPIDSLYNIFKVLDGEMMHKFLKFVTENPANRLGFRKGKIEVGLDADFLILNESKKIEYVVSKGRLFKL